MKKKKEERKSNEWREIRSFVDNNAFHILERREECESFALRREEIRMVCVWLEEVEEEGER